MRKIMLVIDDYKELVALEGFFRRLGFDVLSLGKEILVSGALLSFTPDLVFATAKGRMVDGSKLALRMKKSAPSAKIALVYSAPTRPALAPDVEMAVDALIELPAGANFLIDVTSKLLNLDAQPLLEKYERINASKNKVNERARTSGDEGATPSSDMVTVTGGSRSSAPGVTSASGLAGHGGSGVSANSTMVTGKAGGAQPSAGSAVGSSAVGSATAGLASAAGTASAVSSISPDPARAAALGAAHEAGNTALASAATTDQASLAARASTAHASATALAPDSAHAPSNQAQSAAASVAVEWDPISTPGLAPRARSSRSSGYEEFLKSHDDDAVDGIFPRTKGIAAMKQLKKDSESEAAELEALLEKKREFIRTLFREGAKKSRD